jgi:hypothetical protein
MHVGDNVVSKRRMTLEDINDLRLDAFLANNPDVDIAERKYGRKFAYELNFFADVPVKSVTAFARAIGADHAWIFHFCRGHATLWFNDPLLHTMARSVAGDVELRRCMSRRQALQADAAWEQRALYRVLFPAGRRPSPAEVRNRTEDPNAELICGRTASHRTNGQAPAKDDEVVAVLTDSDETMAWLKLAYAGVRVEQRCAFVRWEQCLGESAAAAAPALAPARAGGGA